MHLVAGLEHKFILLFQIIFSVSNKTRNTKDVKAENLYGNSSIFIFFLSPKKQNLVVIGTNATVYKEDRQRFIYFYLSLNYFVSVTE